MQFQIKDKQKGVFSMNILGYISNMGIPVILFVIGIFFTVKPATKINNLSGHRTKYSKLNQQTWDYAQRTMGKTYLSVTFTSYIQSWFKEQHIWASQPSYLISAISF